MVKAIKSMKDQNKQNCNTSNCFYSSTTVNLSSMMKTFRAVIAQLGYSLLTKVIVRHCRGSTGPEEKWEKKELIFLVVVKLFTISI